MVTGLPAFRGRQFGRVLLIVLVLAMGTAYFLVFSSSAYPRTADSISGRQAARAGTSFAVQIGLRDFRPGRPTTTFDTVAASWFSLSRAPISETTALPIYTWTIPDRLSNCRIDVLVDGSPGGVACEGDAAARLSAEALLRWMRSHDAPASLTEQRVAAIVRTPDQEERWTAARHGVEGDVIIDYAFAHDGSTVSLSQTVHVPESDGDGISRSSFIGEAASTIGFIATLILIVMAVGTILRAERRTGSKRLTVLTAVLSVLVVCTAVNTMTGATVTPPAGISDDSYRAALVLGNGFASVILFVTVKACGEAGSILPPVRIRTGGAAARRTASGAVLSGVLLTTAWLVVSTTGYAAAGRWGLASVRLGPPDAFSVAAVAPMLTPFASALVAAVQEEVLFRWFALRQIFAMTASKGIAVGLTSAIWALIHANYGVVPAASRIIELLPLGLLLAAATLRHGVLAAVVAHYAIDYITLAAPVARVSSTGAGLVLVLLFFLPGMVLLGPPLRPRLDTLGPEGPEERRVGPASSGGGAHLLPALTSRTGEQDCGTIAIAVRSLVKRYEQTEALADVTLNVQYGTVTCLLGPNGAGKSTLMRIIVGHEPLDEGDVCVILPRDAALSDRVVGYVPDSSLVYPLLTVREHLRLVEAVYDVIRLDAGQETMLLESLGLEEHADHLASKLSKGLKKRLMLACAVRQGARVLILDEPFEGLDPDGQDTLMSLISQLRDQGRCVLVSTHRLDIAERIGDELLVLDHGILVFYGTPEEFIQLGDASEERTPFEAAFAAVSRRRARPPSLPGLEEALP